MRKFNKDIRDRVFNLVLRGFSFLTKFLLLFFLAKYLTVQQLGVFGLIMVSISLGVLLIGMEFYTYSQRELFSSQKQDWSGIIVKQVKTQFVMFLFMAPIFLIIFIFGFIDWQWFFWFYLILILEFLAQEVNRLLVAMHRQVVASWVLFFRIAFWVLILIPIFLFIPELRNMETVLLLWFLGGLLAVILGFFAVKNTMPSWENSSVGWAWIKAGLKVSALFFLSTLAFKAILTLDRYWLEMVANLEMLGVYTLYMGLAISINVFLEASVFSFLYPRLVTSYQRGLIVQYRKIFKELLFSTLIISVMLSICLWYLVPYILIFLDKPVYQKHFDAFIYLIIFGFLLSISYVPHYGLYALKKDFQILLSHALSLVVFLMALFFIENEEPIIKIATSLIIAFMTLLLLKVGFYFYSWRTRNALAC